jgi:predicted metal-dependent hydrolase
VRSSLYPAVRSSLYPSQELRRRTLAWALKLRVNPKVVRIQRMRHKWGSCSSKGIVTLASDLAEHEGNFQDFVIAHELLHLRIPNHGRLFKALMTAYVPSWRALQAGNREARAVTPPVEQQSTGSRTPPRRAASAMRRVAISRAE